MCNCNNSLPQLGRGESKKLRACRAHGLKRHQQPWSVHVHWSWANICFFPGCSHLAALWVSLALSKEWFGVRASIICGFWGPPKLELHLQWVPAAGAVRSEALPACQSSRQHRDPEWAREVGLMLHHSPLPGYFKTSLGRVLGIWRNKQSPGSFYFTTTWDLQSSLSWKAVWVTKTLVRY